MERCPLTEGQWAEIDSLMAGSNTLGAVKAIRLTFGVGLREASDILHVREEDLRGERSDGRSRAV
jgi:hypothetical protein